MISLEQRLESGNVNSYIVTQNNYGIYFTKKQNDLTSPTMPLQHFCAYQIPTSYAHC